MTYLSAASCRSLRRGPVELDPDLGELRDQPEEPGGVELELVETAAESVRVAG